MDAIELNRDLTKQGYCAVRAELIPAGVPSTRAEGSAHLAIIRLEDAEASEACRLAVREAVRAVGLAHDGAVGAAYEAGRHVMD